MCVTLATQERRVAGAKRGNASSADTTYCTHYSSLVATGLYSISRANSYLLGPPARYPSHKVPTACKSSIWLVADSSSGPDDSLSLTITALTDRRYPTARHQRGVTAAMASSPEQNSGSIVRSFGVGVGPVVLRQMCGEECRSPCLQVEQQFCRDTELIVKHDRDYSWCLD
jgi:hypothetical protein